MKIITIPEKRINAYTFEELSDNAKEKVMRWLTEDDPFLIESVSESIESSLEYHGIEIDRKYLEWDIDRGGYIAFPGSLKNECEVVTKAIIQTLPDREARLLLSWIDHGLLSIGVSIGKTRGYDSSLSCELDLYWIDPFPYKYKGKHREMETMLNEVQETIQEIVYSIGEDALSDGRKDYEWHFSEEYIKDTCEGNEYLFDEKGNPVHHLGEAE